MVHFIIIRHEKSCTRKNFQKGKGKGKEDENVYHGFKVGFTVVRSLKPEVLKKLMLSHEHPLPTK